MGVMVARTIAAIFALAAFAVAIMAGLMGGNPAPSILVRALLALVCCYPIGLAVGLVAQRLVREHVETHRETNPAPEVEAAALEDALEAGELPAQPAQTAPSKRPARGAPVDEEILTV